MRYDIVCAGPARGVSLTGESVLRTNYDKSRLTFTGVCETRRDLSMLNQAGIKSDCITAAGAFSALANKGAQAGEGEYIVFLAPGVCLHPQALTRLDKYIEKEGEAVAFRLGSLPYTDPVHCDPVTLKTSSVNKNYFVIKRRAFEAVGGFDENLSFALEDIDLSVRLGRAGGEIYSAPAALVFSDRDPAQQSFEEYIYSVYNKWLLADKYLDNRGQKAAKNEYIASLKNPRPFPKVRKTLAKLLLSHSAAAKKVKNYKKENPALREKAGEILAGIPGPDRGSRKVAYMSFGEDNFTPPDFVPVVKREEAPLVSVVVRTHSRPAVLAQTLKSLENRTYKNFEVVIVEDGEPTAQEMTGRDFPSLNINYHATGRHVGRGKAGNIGIEMAKGEFVCLLDDDDYHYPDFLYTHLATVLGSGADMAISGVMAARVRVIHSDPYDYSVERLYPVNFDHITIMDMCVKCRVPSCAGIFRKELYTQYGGLREDIDGDEDWAMWLKYMAWGNRADHYAPDIPAAMAVVFEPADRKEAQRRMDSYRVFDKQMLFDPSLVFTLPGSEIEQCEKYIRADFLHLKYNGLLDDFIMGLKPLGNRRMEYDKDGVNTVTAAQLNSSYYRLIAKYLTEG